MKLRPPDKFPAATLQARQIASDRAVLQGVFAATEEERLHQLQESINAYKPPL